MIRLIIVLISLASLSMVSAKKSYTEAEIKKLVNEKVLEKMRLVSENNIINFSKNLLKKEEKLKKFEMRLKRKEEELKIYSKDLDEKISRFVEKQKKIIGCMDNMEKSKKKRIHHLVEIISGMKPSRAGSVLSVQDSDIAVKILSELPAVKMSKIFNSMNQEISARLQKQYMNMQK